MVTGRQKMEESEEKLLNASCSSDETGRRQVSVFLYSVVGIGYVLCSMQYAVLCSGLGGLDCE